MCKKEYEIRQEIKELENRKSELVRKEISYINYCVGKGLPNVHNLKKICRALKCSVYELVDMEYGEEE